MDVFQGLPSNSVSLCLTSYRSGRRRVLSPRDEHTLVRKMQMNPGTTAKDLVKMLEETCRHNLKGCSARKKPLLQNWHKKSQTIVCICTCGQRSYFLEKSPLV